MTVPDIPKVPVPEGGVIDQLLATVQEEWPQEGEAIVWARRGTRSGRPENVWIWPPEVETKLMDLAGRADSPRLQSLIHDAIAIAHEEKDWLTVEKGWKLKGKPRTPESIELAQFRTSRSFDKVDALFTEHMQTGDLLGLVLRGHLWIEAALNGLIDRSMRDPSQLDAARLSFVQRVALTAALGLISSTEAGVIRKINSLRNRLAHNLESAVTESDQKDLVATCDDYIKYLAGIKSDGGFPEGIHAIISTIVIVLHSRADSLDASSRYEAWLHERVEKLRASKE